MMTDRGETDVPPEMCALIDLILTRHDEIHPAYVASLPALAQKVEEVHADAPEAPKGLAWALASLVQGLEDHMSKQEMILFPRFEARA